MARCFLAEAMSWNNNWDNERWCKRGAGVWQSRQMPSRQTLESCDYIGGLLAALYEDFTDLYNNRARWYDPQAGRFISQDPISFAGGDTNLYRYAGNSPANATDPSGQFANGIAAGIGAVGGGIIGGGAYLFFADSRSVGGFLGAVGGGAAIGALAGLTFGASLAAGAAVGGAGVAGYYGAGAGVGAVHGALDARAAGAGAGMTLLDGALGGLAGAANPAGEFASFGGAVAGGYGQYMAGGQFLGNGFLAGGLAGTAFGGFGTALRAGILQGGVRAGIRAGVRGVAPELAGMGIGGGIGYAIAGNEGILLGANFGMFGGAIGRGLYGHATRSSSSGGELVTVLRGMSRREYDDLVGSNILTSRAMQAGKSPSNTLARRLSHTFSSVGSPNVSTTKIPFIARHFTRRSGGVIAQFQVPRSALQKSVNVFENEFLVLGGTKLMNVRLLSPSYRAGWSTYAAWGVESSGLAAGFGGTVGIATYYTYSYLSGSQP